MNLSVLLLISSTFILSELTNAQSLYGVTSNKDVVRISSDGCFSEIVVGGADLNPDPGLVTDIAYEQGILYGALTSGLCIIHPENGSVDWISMGGLLNLNGLTGDQNGNLYLAGTDVGRYVISSGVLEPIGSLNPYHTSGDVEYVNGSLYITAADSSGENHLLKVETDPFSFSVIGNIPSSCYGLAKSNELDSEHLYITHSNTLYSININNAITTLVCSFISGIPGLYGLTAGPGDLATEKNQMEHVHISQDPISQTLSIITYDKKIRECVIYNELGQEIASVDLSNELTVINTSTYSAGVYLIRFTKGYTLRFAIVK